MPQIIQPHYLEHTQTEDTDTPFSCYKAVKEAKINAKENQQIAASLYDSISNLCTSLGRLDNLMENLIFKEDFDEEKKKSSRQAGPAHL